MRLARLLLAATVMSTVFVLSTPTAGACSCGPSTDQQAFDAADTVFEGELLSYEFDEDPDGDGTISSTDPAVWTFAVTAVYKGDARQTETIYSASARGELRPRNPQGGDVLRLRRLDHGRQPGPAIRSAN